MPRSFDKQAAPLPALWTTLACAVGAQWVHWGWSRIAGQATEQELMVLLMVSLLAWPVALVAACSLLVAVFRRIAGPLRSLALLASGLRCSVCLRCGTWHAPRASRSPRTSTPCAWNRTLPTWKGSEHGRQGIPAAGPA